VIGEQATRSSPRVLVVGLDALTPHLVEKWVADGRLPNLAKLTSQGAWGPLNSVPNRNSAPAWSTMVTGLNPGKHGVYWFTEDDPTTYDYRFVNGSFRRGKAFWRVLSEEGQRVAVINVPLTFPAEPVNGLFISGLDSPGSDDPRFTHPSDLRHEIHRVAGGEYVVHASLAGYVMSGRSEEGLDRLPRSIDRRLAVTQHLLETRPWDAFMVVFTESDVVQHFFWRQMADPAPSDSQRDRNAIEDIYRHLDRVLGELMEAAGENTTVVVVSDHGARYDDGLARALPNWLEQLGMLAYRSGSGRTLLRSLATRGGAALYHELARRLSPEVKHKLSTRLPGARRRVEVMMSFAKLDWSQTKAYTDGVRPEIWINLRGRQPEGVVSAEDYDAVRAEIIEKLESAVCVRTGQPLVRRVRRREDVYSGPFVERSPDLVVEWVDENACLDIRYPDGSTSTLRKEHRPADPYDRFLNGGHDQQGLIALLGPGIRPGRIEGAEIADVTPTVLFLRDAPIPSDVDGRILSGALDADLLASRSPKRGAAAVANSPEGAAYSEEEEAEVRERLQALGYVE
jgi:predicted AlkP superfamily phosphohydrolase/phosphomutase